MDEPTDGGKVVDLEEWRGSKVQWKTARLFCVTCKRITIDVYPANLSPPDLECGTCRVTGTLRHVSDVDAHLAEEVQALRDLVGDLLRRLESLEGSRPRE